MYQNIGLVKPYLSVLIFCIIYKSTNGFNLRKKKITLTLNFIEVTIHL